MDLDAVARAAALIGAAERPMIFVGGGAFSAAQAIRELAELLDAPVVAFRSGRGVLSNDHELGLTMAAAHRLWPGTDLSIGIGTRMELPGWRWNWQPAGLKSVRIDIDPVEMRRSPADVPIVADATEATQALLEACRRVKQSRPGRREAIRAAAAEAEAEIQAIQPQMSYLKVLRDVLPRDGIVTDELSQVGFASWYGFPVYEPRTFISSGYQGTLGSGFPTALGVKVAHPDRPVVAITGDGGFMFGVQELSTAVQYGIGVVTLVFNNGAYGNVRRDQRESFGGRVIASDLVNPDFVAMARAFGAEAERVDSPEAFRPVLERALADGRPWLIEIDVGRDSETSPWRFIHPGPPFGA
ncbi:MAG: acetolactate synthase, large subunit [Enterovirga sp.]|nr:acetolactate synthase, large subunit [Enterovirga sp.]